MNAPPTPEAGPGSRTALALPLLPRLDDYLSHHARHTPAAPACWFMDGWTSYSDLEQRVDAMARALHGLGLRHGDRLAVLSTPRPEFWVSLLAALRIGVVWVGLNPRYTWRELAHVVGDSQPRALLSLAGFEGVDFAEMAQRMRAEFPFIGHAFRLDDGPALGGLEPAAALQERAVGPPGMAAYAARRGAVKGADAAVIVYTSGSSGTPKGAVLPHRSLVYGPRVQAEQNAIARPRVLCNFPINHVACIGDTCASTLIAGGMLAFDERFDPGHYLKLVERLRLTQLAHVPTVLQMLLAHPDFATRELSSLQLVAWGGAALPISAIRAFRARGLRMISIYGMTETVCNVTWADERSSDEVLATTIGRPDPNVALKLVDEQCAEVPEGEQGEIAVRHEALMLGYFNRPEATAASLTPEGFLRTGDLAVRLPDGNYRVVGRRSEMYKSGGYNVYPREVEDALTSHPAVSAAGVFGIADDHWGEAVTAAVVLREGHSASIADLTAHVRAAKGVHQTPKVIHFLDALPLTPVGKPDKKALRARYS